MNKKIILILSLVIGLIFVLILVLMRHEQQPSVTAPLTNLEKTTGPILPSESSIEYNDPAGFTFSYPDNLSITKNEIEDDSTYADLELFSKDVNGSLSLKITDSKFKSLDDWVKINQEASSVPPKQVKLGNLEALEITTNDRLLLGALDKRIFFTVEVPLIEKEFWMKVYDKVLTEFAFAPSVSENTVSAPQTGSSTSDVTFEGEEVVQQ